MGKKALPRLRYQLISRILLISFFPALIVLSVFYLYVRHEMERQFRANLESNGKLVAHEFTEYDKVIGSELSSSVSTPLLIDLLGLPWGPREKEQMGRLLHYWQSHLVADEVVVYAGKGSVLAAAEEGRSWPPIPPAVLAALKGLGGTKVGDAGTVKAIGLAPYLTLDYYAPILAREKGEMLGILRMGIRLDRMLSDEIQRVADCDILIALGDSIAFSTESSPYPLHGDQLKRLLEQVRLHKGDGRRYLALRPPASIAAQAPLTVLVKGNTAFMDRTLASLKLVSLSLLLLILVLALVSSSFLSRWLSEPMSRLVGALDSLSSGDLTQRLRFGLNNEIDRIALAFNTMRDALGEIIASIRDTSTRITTAGHELQAAAEQQAQESKHQYQRLAESIGAALDLSRHAEKIGRSITTVDEASERTLASMGGMKSAMEETSTKIRDLGRRTKEIEKILDLIRSIADETNLLALNAAIEAAHAGEQGSGFAVVAEEVRKLADRSSQATQEIGRIVGSIQKEVSEATNTMEKTAHEVVEGANLATQTSALSKDINKRVLEQLAGTEQIKKTLQEANDVLEQLSSGTMQTARASDQLLSLAVDLQKLSERFRLSKNKKEKKRGRSPAS